MAAKSAEGTRSASATACPIAINGDDCEAHIAGGDKHAAPCAGAAGAAGARIRSRSAVASVAAISSVSTVSALTAVASVADDRVATGAGAGLAGRSTEAAKASGPAFSTKATCSSVSTETANTSHSAGAADCCVLGDREVDEADRSAADEQATAGRLTARAAGPTCRPIGRVAAAASVAGVAAITTIPAVVRSVATRRKGSTAAT